MYQEKVVWGCGLSDMGETWSHAGSLEAAVSGALELADDSGVDWAWICAGQYPDPGEVVASLIDMDELLERMDEYANDNEIYAGDDELFAPRLGAAVAARAALEDALRQWAREWVTASVWTATGVAVAIRNLTAGPVLHSGGAGTAPSARPAERAMGRRGGAEAPGDPGRGRP